jgi:hypothetical protein
MRKILLYSSAEGHASRLTLLDNVASGTSEVIANGNARRWIMTCEYDAGVSAGEVVLESGPSSAFAGTWANEGNSVGSSNGFDRVVSDSSADFVRARISTPIVGGNVTVYLEAEGPY